MWPWKRRQSRKDLAAAYFSSFSTMPIAPDRSEQIRAAIAAKGRFDEVVEWRISTESVISVEPAEIRGQAWYRVSVKCGNEMMCHSPTLERGAQFVRIYEQLVVDMFYYFGWPSWASKDKLHAANGAA